MTTSSVVELYEMTCYIEIHFICLHLFSVSTSFETQYEGWLEKFKNSAIWKQCLQVKCLDNAEKMYNDLSQKIDKFRSTELKHPIMVVYLFTLSYPGIHNLVNKWLEQTDDRLDGSWMSQYSELLQGAMDILLPFVSKNWKLPTPVYRSQHCDHDMNLQVGAKSQSLRFLSTSFNPNEILLFGGDCPIAIEILNARGLPIEIFSECPHEEEVLIKPGAWYIVREHLTDLEKIKLVWEKIVRTTTTELPVIFYQIEIISDDPAAANSAFDEIAEFLLLGHMIGTIMQRRELDNYARRSL